MAYRTRQSVQRRTRELNLVSQKRRCNIKLKDGFAGYITLFVGDPRSGIVLPQLEMEKALVR
jgi:hypothetical protein